ncbi:MAG: adenylate/guanylate cyclase domain-containing protein [Candidatus Gracilibacteria bacterium]|nr:adenylate/guanylate cyclase domain-containing protein [Candidatus Gracilibacteria bacterium]
MEHIDTIKGAVVFTDIKDFTLKTSLLTQFQIGNFLNKQDEIVLPIITKYFGKVIKTIGDSYMIVFEKAENAVLSSIEIQKKLEEYNSNIELNLYKLELRISIDYGNLEREINLNGEDFFGETVNIASRLQQKTPENKIFITGNIQKNIENIENINCLYLGKTSFKGVLYEVDIYEVLYENKIILDFKNGKIKSKNIDDFLLTQDLKQKINEIDNTIFKFSSVAAIVGIQPIPFLDIYSVLPFHIYLLKEIAKKYGIKITQNESKEIMTTVIGSVGSSYMLSQGVVGLSKIGTLGLGGYLMMPLNFGLTYAMGKILSLYFYQKSQGVKATNSEIKELFKYSIKSGKSIAKKDKNKIIEIGKKYKDSFLKKLEKHYPNKTK